MPMTSRLCVAALLSCCLAWCLTGCSPSSGQGSSTLPDTVVYVDPTAPAGGTGTQTRPFRSWASVTFVTGGTYQQRRGTVAYEQLTIGTDDVTLGSYGSGPAPIIDGSSMQTGWVAAGLSNAAIYRCTPVMAVGEHLGHLSVDGVVPIFLTWNSDATTTFTGASAGSFAISPTGTLYCWTSTSDDPDFHLTRISRRLYGITATGVTDLTINDLHIRHASLHGIHALNSSEVHIADTEVEDCGGALVLVSPLTRAGNGIEFGGACRDSSVRRCTISDIFDSGISPQIYQGTVTARAFTFANNQIARCGFAGIEVAVLSNGGATTGSQIESVSISDTTITSCGYGWSRRRYGQEGRGIKAAADTGAGSLDAITISTCTINNCAGEGIYLGGDCGSVQVSTSALNNNAQDGLAWVCPGTSAQLDCRSSRFAGNGGSTRFGLSVAGGSAAVRHNSFASNGLANCAILSVDGSLTVLNNTFNSTAAQLYSAIPLTGNAINNNAYREHGGNIINNNGTLYISVAGFRASTGLETQGVGAADLNLNDLYPQAGSPCIGAGSITPVSTDFNGLPYLSPPSIGAHANT
ncbi:MAG: right-handed parallel beta-helix repeat-containing protein, partial [Planctomycetota bacterium]|nr:right-handed parallel beta-helix repeat-containing protein [Planctomycetota bacterium]